MQSNRELTPAKTLDEFLVDISGEVLLRLLVGSPSGSNDFLLSQLNTSFKHEEEPDYVDSPNLFGIVAMSSRTIRAHNENAPVVAYREMPTYVQAQKDVSLSSQMEGSVYGDIRGKRYLVAHEESISILDGMRRGHLQAVVKYNPFCNDIKPVGTLVLAEDREISRVYEVSTRFVSISPRNELAYTAIPFQLNDNQLYLKIGKSEEFDYVKDSPVISALI